MILFWGTFLWSFLFITIGVLIIARNPKDMAKNSPLDYLGFGIALIGGLPVWISLLLFLVIVLFIAVELHDADF